MNQKLRPISDNQFENRRISNVFPGRVPNFQTYVERYEIHAKTDDNEIDDTSRLVPEFISDFFENFVRFSYRFQQG